jgi:hypothetical protein
MLTRISRPSAGGKGLDGGRLMPIFATRQPDSWHTQRCGDRRTHKGRSGAPAAGRQPRFAMRAKSSPWEIGDRRRSAFRHLPGRAGPGHLRSYAELRNYPVHRPLPANELSFILRRREMLERMRPKTEFLSALGPGHIGSACLFAVRFDGADPIAGTTVVPARSPFEPPAQGNRMNLIQDRGFQRDRCRKLPR